MLDLKVFGLQRCTGLWIEMAATAQWSLYAPTTGWRLLRGCCCCEEEFFVVSAGEIQALDVEVADLNGFRRRELVLREDLLCEGAKCGSSVLWWSVVAVRVD